MDNDSSNCLKGQKERQNSSCEAITAEKQLWSLVHSKGILHTEVQDLYRKTRAGHEKIILNDHEEVELQEVEYSLWKLHYKHIDEFRKRIRQTSVNTQSTKLAMFPHVADVKSDIDCPIEKFKLFLSEATEFYQVLIIKLRRCYGLPEDPLVHEKRGVSCSVEPAKFHKCQYLCHRFLVCLGDLARYGELCKKLDNQKHNWSVAANYYYKATLVWPDSGGPQNQLALLATYVGDEFLAMYHCIRSLAIKEPFPDAWDNLILLFDKNRSSNLLSLSMESHFNFLNPSERTTSLAELQSSSGSLANDTPRISSAKREMWPLFVRMISFFFSESSLEEFPCTFTSTMREWEFLLALDDIKLKATLESCQLMYSTRTGPYRALQMVSVLIFIIDCLTESVEYKESKKKDNARQPVLVQFALVAAFIFLGRLVERCLKGNDPPEYSPLLPPVLVFIEWLVGNLDKVEAFGAYEKVRSAISYFFYAFVDLLNQLDDNESEWKYQNHLAIWEDHELRGFAPVASAHCSLDFTIRPKNLGNFDRGNVYRAQRIWSGAMKIVDRSGDSHKLIFYNHLQRKFYSREVAESSSDRKMKEPLQRRETVAKSTSDLEVKEPQQKDYGATNGSGKGTSGEKESHPFDNGQSVAMEEEEVILFKPIKRYNSAPPHMDTTGYEMSVEGMKDQTVPSDEYQRRATSLFVGQNETQKDTATYPAGPPSLSAWVLDTESSNVVKEKGTRSFYKPGLNPIDEMASASLIDLSISETEDSVNDRHVSITTPYSPPYLGPVPSAPLLPDDAIWYSGSSSSSSEGQGSGNTQETDSILVATPMRSYTNWSANQGPYGYQPVLGMTSSEWLHQYTNQNHHRPSTHVWPVHCYAPGKLGNFYRHDTSRFDLCDQWGNPVSPNHQWFGLESPQILAGSPLMYGVDEQRKETLSRDYQRPSPYGCGAVTDLRAEQPPLLQYLKEKERQLQGESRLRGPT